jgi:hypothetical protein
MRVRNLLDLPIYQTGSPLPDQERLSILSDALSFFSLVQRPGRSFYDRMQGMAPCFLKEGAIQACMEENKPINEDIITALLDKMNAIAVRAMKGGLEQTFQRAGLIP